MMRSARFWTVVLLMAATSLALHQRGDADRVPPSRPLHEFPMTIGGRTAVDVAINADALELLGKGDFLNRNYLPTAQGVGGDVDAKPGVAAAPIGLFMAYFATQRTGQSIHSPQNCLPGAGWSFQATGETELRGATGEKIRVGEYLITDGISTQEVLYWYQMQGQSIAGDYTAKLYTLADSIRYGRTDAALVRIITPIETGEERADARARAVGFAEQIEPLLSAYVPD
jgi:EpsI family protein